MSMHHVNPKSKQCRAWVEHARQAEGRIVRGFVFKSINRTSSSYEARKAEKHNKICNLLEHFDFVESRETPKDTGYHRTTVDSYVRFLVKNGYMKMTEKRVNRKLYVRTKAEKPTLEEVTR